MHFMVKTQWYPGHTGQEAISGCKDCPPHYTSEDHVSVSSACAQLSEQKMCSHFVYFNFHHLILIPFLLYTGRL